MGQEIVGERQGAEVQDRATRAGQNGRAAVGQAVGHRQPGDGHGRAGADVEDPAGVVAADSQLIGTQPLDVQALGDGQLAAGQCNGLTGETQ
jgi:hypothetical protein